ncbi:CDGSH iron-sulfur domain-containing protein [Streptomyces sp. GC420]|uniref:CDGSH iron-sulfur domain-containing protein n=1 Tax=Streptomyces sp. GC420 TaxID=2697568 RepID=UPI0014152AEC|nr:CDGSH iron-sulfur domain-containing protein [Streptomyces sp. GC420]NBM18940.1 CDGSH iron-sulfur domain-containing protein [Streptomyces sp. GC420]
MPSVPERPRRVTIDREGPVLVEGPVEVTTETGEVVRSDRFVTAICTCRRSRMYPWCDTSHRRRVKSGRPASPADGTEPARPDETCGGPAPAG